MIAPDSESRGGNLRAMRARNVRELQQHRRTHCLWGIGCPNPVAGLWVHHLADGWECEPFGICAEHTSKVKGRRDFAPWTGGHVA